MGENSLPKTLTRQRRDCDLNPGPSAPESSTLTTRLPSHPSSNCNPLNSGQAGVDVRDGSFGGADVRETMSGHGVGYTCTVIQYVGCIGDLTWRACKRYVEETARYRRAD